MNTWYCKELGDRVEAATAMAQIQQTCDRLYLSSPSRSAVAIVSQDDWRGSKKLVTAFFSPAARELATILSATECKRPERNAVSVEMAYDIEHLESLFQ